VSVFADAHKASFQLSGRIGHGGRRQRPRRGSIPMITPVENGKTCSGQCSTLCQQCSGSMRTARIVVAGAGIGVTSIDKHGANVAGLTGILAK
jgi:hypothetical protein